MCAGFHALQIVLTSSDLNLQNPYSSVLPLLSGSAWAEHWVGEQQGEVLRTSVFFFPYREAVI